MLVGLWRLQIGLVMAYYWQSLEQVWYKNRAYGWAKVQTDCCCAEVAIWIGGRRGMPPRDPEWQVLREAGKAERMDEAAFVEVWPVTRKAKTSDQKT